MIELCVLFTHVDTQLLCFWRQVRASTEIGWGAWSTSVHGFTTEAVPAAPLNLRNVSRTRTSLTLAWDEPLQINGVLIGYSVGGALLCSCRFLYRCDAFRTRALA